MKKIILQCAISKDGFIARKNGDFDFLMMPSDPLFHDYFKAFLENIDIIVMGYQTYQVMKQIGPMPFKDIDKLVFTRNHLNNQDKNVTFTNQSIENFLKYNQKYVWLFGGADLFTQFLELDGIDEIHVYQEQVSIGEGIPLFHRKGWEKQYQKPHISYYQKGSLLIYKKKPCTN